MGDAEKRVVVVIGATGRQGGATVRALEKTGRFTVVGVSRHPDGPDAAAFRALHPAVALRRGDCNDKASLLTAFSGAWGVFAVTNPFASRWTGVGKAHVDMDAEERQGRNQVDAAVEAGVAFLVFASVASALEGTGVPTFDVKVRVAAGRARVWAWAHVCGRWVTLVRGRRRHAWSAMSARRPRRSRSSRSLTCAPLTSGATPLTLRRRRHAWSAT